MTEEHGTLNLKHKTMSRDIDALRQRYVEHKQSLDRLAADAPTEALALRYRQVSAEIDAAIQKLGELERGIDKEPLTAPGVTAPGVAPKLDENRRTAPGMKSLRSDPQVLAPVVPVESTGARTLLILGVGVLILGLLGFFVWRFAFGDDEPSPTSNITDTSATSTQATTPVARSILTAEPLTQDYGSVQRGSRATRQFELLNSSDQPLTIRANRSECRCLWFEYADTIPPQGSTTMTVTVDGSKAKDGPLHETVQVTSKTNPSITTTFEVVAEVR